MFSLIQPFFTIAKMYILGIIAVAVFAYIGWLHWTISDQQSRVISLENAVKACDSDRSKLMINNKKLITANNELNRTMNIWNAYYNERGCLDLNDNALKPDEMKIKIK